MKRTYQPSKLVRKRRQELVFAAIRLLERFLGPLDIVDVRRGADPLDDLIAFVAHGQPA